VPADARGLPRLAAQCRLTRYGLDCYAYALLALGQIDLVVEAGLRLMTSRRRSR
jgi:fructose-1,6-bisphosphatase/inositol monophosphatase family enzyme